MDDQVKYWIDTDPGVDDAIAIILASRKVNKRLIGFSTVQGNFSEPVTALNLARIVHALQESGVTPHDWHPAIARGSVTSLLGSLYTGDPKSSYHGRNGLADVSWEPGPDWEPRKTRAAAEAIIDHATRNPGLRLLLIGPLTNLALAVRLAPELPKLVGTVAVMGGSLRAGGNETMAAEFNFFADAEAAQIVLHAGFEDLRLIPLDVCDGAKLTLEEFHRLSQIESPAARLVTELVSHWKELLSAGRGIPIYDAVAWLALCNPALVKWEPVYVAVDTSRGLAHGASIADWRRRTKNPPNVLAATEIKDRSRFFDLLFEAVS